MCTSRQKETDELAAEQKIIRRERAILKKIGKQTVIEPNKDWVVPINNDVVKYRQDQVSVGKFFYLISGMILLSFSSVVNHMFEFSNGMTIVGLWIFMIIF